MIESVPRPNALTASARSPVMKLVVYGQKASPYISTETLLVKIAATASKKISKRIMKGISIKI